MTTDFKVVICGNYSCGKTSLLNRFLHRQFTNYASSTIGASFLMWKYETNNNKISIGFFDTAGQERFSSLIPMYYRSAQAILYCIALDCDWDKEVEKVKRFLENLNETNKKCLLYLVVTKIDLDRGTPSGGDYETSLQHFNSFLEYTYNDKKFSRLFFTSSMSGDGVDSLFESLGNELMSIQPLKRPEPRIELYSNTSNVKKCCY